MKVVFSPIVRADLVDITRYIVADNLSVAQIFRDGLAQASRRLGGTPLIGRMRSELGEGLRSFMYGHYLIFYRVLPTELRIERFLHGARDIGPDDM